MIPEWRRNAACAQLVAVGRAAHKDWQSGVGTNVTGPNRRAIKVCRGCPVRIECRDWALAEARRGRRPVFQILAGWVWRLESVVALEGEEHLLATLRRTRTTV